MAYEILLAKRNGKLCAIDQIGIDYIITMGENEIVKATLVRPRNIDHHRMFFAMLHLVFENQTRYSTIEDLLDAIKIGLGFYKEVHALDGRIERRPKSISFANMEQKAFSQFFDKAVDLVINKILVTANRDDLLARVYEILDGNQPKIGTRQIGTKR